MKARKDTLAYRTGAVVVCGAGYQMPGGRWHVVFCPPIDVEVDRRGDVQALTQRIAADLEYLIRLAPGQWHLFQPNWPSDPGHGE